MPISFTSLGMVPEAPPSLLNCRSAVEKAHFSPAVVSLATLGCWKRFTGLICHSL